jgi:hypothetical protein
MFRPSCSLRGPKVGSMMWPTPTCITFKVCPNCKFDTARCNEGKRPLHHCEFRPDSRVTRRLRSSGMPAANKFGRDEVRQVTVLPLTYCRARNVRCDGENGVLLPVSTKAVVAVTVAQRAVDPGARAVAFVGRGVTFRVTSIHRERRPEVVLAAAFLFSGDDDALNIA